MALQSGDIVHFQTKGLKRILKGLNRKRCGVVLSIWGIDFVATVVDGVVKIIPFGQFNDEFFYISSRPLWVDGFKTDIASRIGMRYKSDKDFVCEVLGAKDVQDVLIYCVKKGWVTE